jgi:hypothetical protein
MEYLTFYTCCLAVFVIFLAYKNNQNFKKLEEKNNEVYKLLISIKEKCIEINSKKIKVLPK